jgi:hypothetical protein
MAGRVSPRGHLPPGPRGRCAAGRCTAQRTEVRYVVPQTQGNFGSWNKCNLKDTGVAPAMRYSQGWAMQS